MEIKLFGKSLFEFKGNKADYFIGNSRNQLKDSPYLPDFYTNPNQHSLSEVLVYEDTAGTLRAIDKSQVKKGKPGKGSGVQLTPKGVFELKMLHDDSVKIRVAESYIEEQIAIFKDKINLLKSSETDMGNGVSEIASILIRLENRKKYEETKEFFEIYPYTTQIKVNELLKNHDHLKIGKVEQFLADMPKEAVEVMKEYEGATKIVCGKKPIFYIIANKKDFQKTESRRDPILLAQSPFAHLWQILGVWDKEMVLLDEI